MTGPAEWTIYRLRDGGRHDRDVVARIRADAVVADLTVALEFGPDTALVIDGRRGRPTDGLDELGLCQGSIVEPAAASGPRPTSPPAGGSELSPCRVAPADLALVVRHGLAAGARLELAGGDYLVGRSAACDLRLEDSSVALLHAVVRLHPDGRRALLEELGDTTRVEQAGRSVVHTIEPATPLHIGATEVELDHVRGAEVPGADPRLDRTSRGTVLFNRPPRVRPGSSAGSPTAPRATAAPGAVPLAVVSIVLPLLLAAVLVVVTDSWLFALLTVLSPIMVLANWLSGRRRARHHRHRHGREFSRRLVDFEAELIEARAVYDTEVDARAVDLAEVARRISGPASSLWERRLEDSDALHVTLGRAWRPWRPNPAGASGSDEPAVLDVLHRAGAPRNRPVELDLDRERVIGVVGDADAARRVARSLVLQLVALHGPADLAVVGVSDERGQHHWSWLRWLPHRVGGGVDPVGGSGSDGAGTGQASPLRGEGAESTSIRRGSGLTPGAPSAGVTVLGGLLAVAAAGRRAAGTSAAPRQGPGDAAGRRLLLIVDDEAAVTGRGSPVRAALRGEAGPVVGIVIATGTERLPATCRTIIDVDAAGAARVIFLRGDRAELDVQAMGASLRTASELAAQLARYEDPELDLPGGGLPDRVGLLDLLGRAGHLSPEQASTDTVSHRPSPATAAEPLDDALVRSWSASSGAQNRLNTGRGELAAPIGVGLDGAVIVDLVGDGPHALVAGTTGAGKSELLRSWIMGLAAGYSPLEVNFVLIDFKGGSVFDACARLPHTVSVVTDLDDELAERVLRCLQAELAHRERVLRAAGVADLADLPHDENDPPLARLVVVIDEFATLAGEIPDFLDTLIGIAQRGRSLGVHLVLATQRPSGVVNDQIRANTNIRIALRVQDRADSIDVIDRADAAELSRRWPGRAFVRLGRNDVTAVQSAFAGTVGAQQAGVPVQLLAGRGDEVAGTRRSSTSVSLHGRLDGPTDLERLVASARRTARRLGLPPARVPWPEPLPARLSLDTLDGLAPPPPGAPRGSDGLAGEAALVPFLLLDDPDEQCREVGGWRPADGNLIVYGTTGAGTSTTLRALVAALLRQRSPASVHLQIIGDDPEWHGLAGLPHVGSVVTRADRERLGRLLRHLEAELGERRRAAASATAAHGHGQASPMIVLVIDGFGSLIAELANGGHTSEDADRLCRVVMDGPALGIHAVLSAEHGTAVRYGVAASIAQKLVLRLAEPLEARQLDVGAVNGPAGRGRRVGCGRLFQVADPGPVERLVHEVVTRWVGVANDSGTGVTTTRDPWRARRLPGRVDWRQLPLAPTTVHVDAGGAAGALWLPIGVEGTGLQPVGWWLRPGEGVLVAGPARSGRSGVLAAAVELIRRAHPDLLVVGVAPRRSPLRDVLERGDGCTDDTAPVWTTSLSGQRDVLGVVPVADRPTGPRVLVVDDADTVEDPDNCVATALQHGWVVLVAARADALRTAYGHWTRVVRSGRTGLLLRPDPDFDGELLGVRLPRRPEAPLDQPGRGVLVQDGTLTIVQAATASG